MRHHSTTALVAIIVAIAVFLATYTLLPRTSNAPGNSTVPSNAPVGSVMVPVSLVIVKENASTSASINIEYPQFPSLPKEFNSYIAGSVTGRLADFRKSMAENSAARNATANNLPGEPGASIAPNAFSFIANWQGAQINDKYVSFIIRFDSYTGGANENQEVETFNYDVSAKKMMSLGDLFPAVPDYLDKISALSRQQLSDSLGTASPGYDPTPMLNAGTEPTPENFRNFTFTDYAVTFYFPKYAVAPGAFGEQRTTILLTSVK